MTKTGWTGIFREVGIEQQSVCFNSWFSKYQNWEIHVRSVILGKRNRSPSIPPVPWQNLCSQLLLRPENDQLEVWSLSRLGETKISEFHVRFSKIQPGPPFPPTRPETYPEHSSQLGLSSENERFKEGPQNKEIWKKNCCIHKGIEFTISRGHSHTSNNC